LSDRLRGYPSPVFRRLIAVSTSIHDVYGGKDIAG
jgi:hypothetical protein